jgi:hypothetical protein
MTTVAKNRERANKLRKQFTDKTIDEMEDMTVKSSDLKLELLSI